ncbi:MAG: Fic family protein [Gammaproteobacteria bacterium]|nr:Fic family protein [Gammaproteobacteria bacterium]MDE0513657.1 Fic family protein [Gammaproteobacteria bacterium]
MGWKPDKPYNTLPSLPPEGEIETKTVLKQCIKSRSALAELNQAAQLIPNPAMLINTLPLLEAKDSSEIENIITTTDKLFRHIQSNGVINKNLDPATKEALRYRTALLDGYRSIGKRPLNTNTVESICSQIRNVEMAVRKVPGTTLANDKTGEIIYTPPEGESLIRQLLANWEKYIHDESDVDPVIRMAVSHYQFEAIHPFTDGNGRTGRIINNLLLIKDGLLSLPILYLSRYIINNKSDYYRLLLLVTKRKSWNSWIMYMLKGIEETSIWTTAKIEAIRRLNARTVDYVHTLEPKIYSRELVDAIFEQPYCRISNLDDKNIAKRQTAAVYLKKLETIGVLKSEKVGRESLYINSKLMELLSKDSNEFDDYKT